MKTSLCGLKLLFSSGGTIALIVFLQAQEGQQNAGSRAEKKGKEIEAPEMLLLRPAKGTDPHKFWAFFGWDEMYSVEQKLWRVLGWDQQMWDSKWDQKPSSPASRSKNWSELSSAEQMAAAQLGFDETTWRAKEPSPSKPIWVDPNDSEPEGSKYKTFHSKTIDGLVSYLIYLPEEYSAFPDRRYPVVYHLPGANGNQSGLKYFLEKLKPVVKTGQTTPMIVVGVNGIQGSYYRDPPSGKVPIESVIIHDLIPHVDQTYRTIARPEGRALEGGSMGGFGALHYGMKYPDKFGVISSLCPVILGGADSPWRFAVTNADSVRGHVRIRLLCGTEDRLIITAKAYHEFLDRLHIPHEYREVEGVGHGSPTIYSKLDHREAIGFFSEAFRGEQPPSR